MNKRRRLLLAPQAIADLEEIAEYISRDNPARANSFIAELQATCRSIAAAPKLFPAREHLAPGLRMGMHGRYLIFYRDLAPELTVRLERILHGARYLPSLF